MFSKSKNQRGLGTGAKVLIFLVVVVLAIVGGMRLITPKLANKALLKVMEEQARFGEVKSNAIIIAAIKEVAKKHNIPLKDPARDIQIRRNYPKKGEMEIKVKPYKKTADLIVYKKVYVFKPRVAYKMGRGIN